MAERKDIKRKRGDTYPVKITIKENGKIIHITGFTGKLSVSTKQQPTAADYVFQSVGVIADEQSGKMYFPITETDANNLGDFYYDIEIMDESGYTHTPVEGKISFSQDITK